LWGAEGVDEQPDELLGLVVKDHSRIPLVAKESRADESYTAKRMRGH
jgi:hypothetical protein